MEDRTGSPGTPQARASREPDNTDTAANRHFEERAECSNTEKKPNH